MDDVIDMRLPGTPSLILLAYVLVFLPWAAFRSARRLRAARDGGAQLPSKEAIWIGTLFSQGMLFLLAWLVGRTFDDHLFAMPPLRTRDILAALLALGLYFGLRSILRAVTPEEERKRKNVYLLAPRTGREWALCAATILVASVAEELAYRGVVMSILWYSLGNPWIAALISATAFALAHWIQGWKSGIVIFCMALVMHGLVAVTHTLVLAMVVHAVYDFVAGYRIARDAEALRVSSSGMPTR